MKRIGLLCLAAACSSSSPKQPDAAVHVDAPVDVALDAPADVPEGVGGHYHYVVNRMTWPTTNQQARDDGFDLDGNGTIDNQLGMDMASFASMGFDAQMPTDTAIAQGATITLADLETTDLTNASGATFTVYDGANPVPPACNGSNDTVCGHHLTGLGSFDVSSTSARDTPIPGTVASGSFAGGPGHLTVPLFVLSGMPVSITLLAAHAHFTPTLGGLTGTIGGAVSQDDLNFRVYPTIVPALNAAIVRDCNMLSNPPGCGCASQSQGATVVGQFDTNQDCMVTVDELKNNQIIMALFATDVTVENQPALSVGFAFTAVDATFTP